MGRGADGQWRVPLGWALGLAMVLVAAVPLGIVLAIGFDGARTNTRALFADRVNYSLAAVRTKIAHHLEPVTHQVAGLRDALESGQLDVHDPIRFPAFVFGSLAATPQVTSIAFVDAMYRVDRFDRDVRRHYTENWRYLAKAEAMLARARERPEPWWSEPVWSPIFRETVIALQVPVTIGGRFAGVLLASVTVRELSRYLAELAAELGQTPFVLYDSVHVLAHPALAEFDAMPTAENPLPALDEIGDPVLARLWEETGSVDATVQSLLRGTGHIITVDDGDYSVLCASVDGYGPEVWIIGSYSRGLIAGAELRRLAEMGLLGVWVLCGAVVVALILARVIGRPVLRLADAARQMDTGDLERVEPVPAFGIRELDVAGRAFNHMVKATRERRIISELFGRYVPPEVARRLVADPKAFALGGERREISLLFTDIAGFTHLSEAHAAEAVVPLLNRYLDALCRTIADEGGVVVDFIGDAVFAIFGAPIAGDDHAERALRAAYEIERFGLAFAVETAARGTPFGVTRVAVHTGVAMVGTFGSAQRLKYGAAGDSVNVAARLEGANKLFSTRLLVSRATAAKAAGGCYRPVGSLRLRGRTAPLEVFEPLNGTDPAAEWLVRYRLAYGSIGVDDHAATIAFEALAAARPDDPVIRFHLDRLHRGDAASVLAWQDK